MGMFRSSRSLDLNYCRPTGIVILIEVRCNHDTAPTVDTDWVSWKREKGLIGDIPRF